MVQRNQSFFASFCSQKEVLPVAEKFVDAGLRRHDDRVVWPVGGYFRFTAKGAKAWQVGIISMRLMFMWGGRETIQAADSAMSSGVRHCVPA